MNGLYMKSNRFWVILICGILVVCAAIAGTQYALSRQSVEWAFIYQDGNLIDVISITSEYETQTILLEYNSGINVIEATRGRVRVSSASCPDNLCVSQGWSSNVPITCLPHRLVIMPASINNLNVDAFTG